MYNKKDLKLTILMATLTALVCLGIFELISFDFDKDKENFGLVVERITFLQPDQSSFEPCNSCPCLLE